MLTHLVNFTDVISISHSFGQQAILEYWDKRKHWKALINRTMAASGPGKS